MWLVAFHESLFIKLGGKAEMNNNIIKETYEEIVIQIIEFETEEVMTQSSGHGGIELPDDEW